MTVCLPDEIRSLSGSSLAPRTIAVPPDEALPLIVQSQHARIGKEGETLKITDEEKGETQVRFIDISDVALFGNVSITRPALSALLEREIPVTFHSHSGWFRGVAHGVGHRNVEIRRAQYRLRSLPRPAPWQTGRSCAGIGAELRRSGRQRSTGLGPHGNPRMARRLWHSCLASKAMRLPFISAPSRVY